MKKQLYAFLSIFILSFYSHAQIVSYHLQQSLTVAQLDSTLAASGFNIPLTPQYGVDIYQVIYKTPYRHIDSLVNASGIVAFPKDVTCPMAILSYHHGTFSKRLEVPSYQGPERPISLFFSGIGGVVTTMPDELGLGDSDSSIIIHPYMNAFHSSYAAVNLLRAARQLADTLSFLLNGEVGLTGYSQGGYTTMAVHKLIEENFSGEFNLIASAPMSGAYDLRKTMVDVMLSSSPYSVPGYLPYLLLGYHSVYPQLQQLYPNPADIFKHPYDSILPPMFYSKLYSLGEIDNFCNPVPRLMIKDSIMDDFEINLQHPFRLILTENDMLGWAPQAPVKVHYCTADQQVSYLNAIRADSAWRANGAPNIEIENMGDFDHGPCVEPSITSAAFYLLGKVSTCAGISVPQTQDIAFRLFPNPTEGQVLIAKEEGAYDLKVFDMNGRLMFAKTLLQEIEKLDLSYLPKGLYSVELRNVNGHSAHRKLMVQ